MCNIICVIQFEICWAAGAGYCLNVNFGDIHQAKYIYNTIGYYYNINMGLYGDFKKGLIKEYNYCNSICQQEYHFNI